MKILKTLGFFETPAGKIQNSPKFTTHLPVNFVSFLCLELLSSLLTTPPQKLLLIPSNITFFIPSMHDLSHKQDQKYDNFLEFENVLSYLYHCLGFMNFWEQIYMQIIDSILKHWFQLFTVILNKIPSIFIVYNWPSSVSRSLKKLHSWFLRRP